MPLVTDTGWTAELTELLREFFPGGDDVEVRHARRDTEPKNIFTIEGKTYPFVSVFPDTRLNMAKRNAKLGLYDALSASTGRSLPWGSLTGVRPTKLFCEAVRCGMDYPSAERFMTDVYRVSAPKAALRGVSPEAQRGLDALPGKSGQSVRAYPVRRSRCTYCRSSVRTPTGIKNLSGRMSTVWLRSWSAAGGFLPITAMRCTRSMSAAERRRRFRPNRSGGAGCGKV